MLENLLSDHKSIIRQIRKDIDRAEQLGDIGTADFLTKVILKMKRLAWMLRAFKEL